VALSSRRQRLEPPSRNVLLLQDELLPVFQRLEV
jgi:hypothetical protein